MNKDIREGRTLLSKPLETIRKIGLFKTETIVINTSECSQERLDELKKRTNKKYNLVINVDPHNPQEEGLTERLAQVMYNKKRRGLVIRFNTEEMSKKQLEILNGVFMKKRYEISSEVGEIERLKAFIPPNPLGNLLLKMLEHIANDYNKQISDHTKVIESIRTDINNR